MHRRVSVWSKLTSRWSKVHGAHVQLTALLEGAKDALAAILMTEQGLLSADERR